MGSVINFILEKLLVPFISVLKSIKIHVVLVKNNSVSALAEHTKNCVDYNTIADFDLDYLKCLSDPVDATLAEAKLIDFYNPTL